MKKENVIENHLDETEPKWFAIYTKYKREKLVNIFLQEKGINCYLPTQKLVRKYAKSKRTVELPLFSCYMFVYICKQEYVPVLDTEHVVKFVRFSKNLIAIPENEIQLIKRILEEEVPIEVEQWEWNTGDEVEVAAGALTGLKGKLVERKNKSTFIVEFEKLGYNLLVDVDPASLHKKESY